MRPRAAAAASFAMVALSLGAGSPASSDPVVPALFQVDTIAAGFDTPTAIAFLPGGRMLVAEKRGRVFAVMNGVANPTPLWSRENEVLNEDDRGLLGLAVDPSYVTNRYLYFLYTVDPDSNGTDTNNDAFGRLVRYRVSATDSNTVDYATRTVLMGVSWRYGPLSASPSHTVGSLRFGTDGSLLVSVGDGASYTLMDAGLLDAPAFGSGPNKTDPYEDIGAFRALSLSSLCGKILRLNPANGQGYASNPYWDGNGSSIRSRVWAYGLRNPFRFCVRPGSGSINPTVGDPGTVYVGDVGWNTWEEMDVVRTPGTSFGWPCDEGPSGNALYRTATPAHNGCASFGQQDNPVSADAPTATWDHYYPDLSQPAGLYGNCSVGGVFYTGSQYPADYRNAYFFGDYGQSWMKVATFDANDRLLTMQDFATGMDGPVDFATHPITGDVYYVAIEAGQVRRLRYTVAQGNRPPIASASASPSAGLAPLAVTFSSTASSDPDSDALGFSWTFGDGGTSVGAGPTHTFSAEGSYRVVLTVSDGKGGVGRDTVVVLAASSSDFPSTPVRDGFNRPDGTIGGAWVDDVAALRIVGQELGEQSGAASTVWNGAVFGPNQEAYVRFDATTPTASEEDLMLAVQGTSWSAGHVEVRYDAKKSRVTVSTYAPSQGWVTRGVLNSITLLAGDPLGARLLANGTVQVFKSRVQLGTASVTGWPFLGSGGRIGLTLVDATQSRLDDFGGGDVSLGVNTPPIAQILSPVNGGFYAAGDTIRLRGAGTDAENPPQALHYHWQVDIHHNTHIHPSTFVSDLQNDVLIGENHDDGTGVYLEVNLVVTDTGGLSDTATVDVYPEIDLRPGALVTSPAWVSSGRQAEFRFQVANDGRMPSPLVHWTLRLDTGLLAEGDTLVPARDSVIVSRVLSAPAYGTHTLRTVVDSLGRIVEVNESNNAATRALQVGAATVAVEDVPAELELSAPRPNPMREATWLALGLPRASRVGFAVFDLQGRQVWRAATRSLAAGRWELSWTGRTSTGSAARPGVYLATVAVDGRTFVRRVAVTR